MSDDLIYPDTPGFKVSGPSEQVAEAMAERATNDYARLDEVS
jgi:hypothetical protein